MFSVMSSLSMTSLNSRIISRLSVLSAASTSMRWVAAAIFPSLNTIVRPTRSSKVKPRKEDDELELVLSSKSAAAASPVL